MELTELFAFFAHNGRKDLRGPGECVLASQTFLIDIQLRYMSCVRGHHWDPSNLEETTPEPLL